MVDSILVDVSATVWSIIHIYEYILLPQGEVQVKVYYKMIVEYTNTSSPVLSTTTSLPCIAINRLAVTFTFCFSCLCSYSIALPKLPSPMSLMNLYALRQAAALGDNLHACTLLLTSSVNQHL